MVLRSGPKIGGSKLITAEGSLAFFVGFDIQHVGEVFLNQFLALLWEKKSRQNGGWKPVTKVIFCRFNINTTYKLVERPFLKPMGCYCFHKC